MARMLKASLKGTSGYFDFQQSDSCNSFILSGWFFKQRGFQRHPEEEKVAGGVGDAGPACRFMAAHSMPMRIKSTAGSQVKKPRVDAALRLQRPYSYSTNRPVLITTGLNSTVR